MSTLSSRLPSMVVTIGVMLCGWLMPTRAWAWAPMCDTTASTTIAPMVAPPVESGEIHPCAPSLERQDDGRQARVYEGQVPQPPGEESTGHDSTRFPFQVGAPVEVVPSCGHPTLLAATAIVGGPSPGFTRAIERPPCTARARAV